MVIWLGDFNYRIGLGNPIVRDLITQRDYTKLYDNDQVRALSDLTFFQLLTKTS